MELVIDGSRIASEEDLHDVISKGLALPNWYGRNLEIKVSDYVFDTGVRRMGASLGETRDGHEGR
ncbi:barstar family protein [Achromobacter sp. DH1f]|uniref:barstar family protein n=1 Tax=Achromobacter sp. DH1f TaxID=1397275 RepID=UPI0009DD0540